MLALVLALAAAAAPAAPLPPKVVAPLVIRPDAKESPPVDATIAVGGDEDSPANQAVSIWPAWAYQARASGVVTLTCWVNVQGLAEWCRVAYEKPFGKGFGGAALAMRPNFKVTPRKGPDGAPVAGLMNIALNFPAPDTEINASMDAGMNGRAANVEVTHNALPSSRITLMNNPVWVKAPSFDQLAAVYPAGGEGVEGYAVAHCHVERDGQLDNCRMATEAPKKKGFGPAAVKLAAQFRVMPEVMAKAPLGEPIEVDVPIRFTPPGGDKAVTAPTWLMGFDPETAPRMFPPEAAAKGLTSGRGVARCTVAADGSMSGCAPDGADPEGLGFSEAVVRLASTMRMNLWSADARPVEGGTVRVAVRLNLKTAD